MRLPLPIVIGLSVVFFFVANREKYIVTTTPHYSRAEITMPPIPLPTTISSNTPRKIQGGAPPPPQLEPENNLSPPSRADAEIPFDDPSSYSLESNVPPDETDVSESAENHDINETARKALVNILCSGSSNLPSISGSGVFIDPQGVILTNAHIAQYVLLSSNSGLGMQCLVRSGSPARPAWFADVLYLPEHWVDAHAQNIRNSRPTGTGEADYALLYVTGSPDTMDRPQQFPHIAYTTKEMRGPGQAVLVAAYPAELASSQVSRNNFFAISSMVTVQKIMTFTKNLTDVISLGGTIVAQGGSSGGAVVSVSGDLIGLIVTTSEGKTTGERDLRAITLTYINRDLRAATGKSLTQILSGNLQDDTEEFLQGTGKGLMQRVLGQ